MGLWQNHCEGSRPSSSTRTAVAKGPLDYYHYYMNISKVLRYSTHCQGISQFHLHTLSFIRKQNEPYLPLPSQPQPVLIYRPRRDGRLSRPWCEVAARHVCTLAACFSQSSEDAPLQTLLSVTPSSVFVVSVK